MCHAVRRAVRSRGPADVHYGRPSTSSVSVAAPPRPPPRSAAARTAARPACRWRRRPPRPTYSGSRARCPTSGASRPRGSKPVGDQREPGGGPGHHPVRPGERAQRQQLAVHDRGPQQRRRRRSAPATQPAQRVEPGADRRRRSGPAQRRPRARTPAGGQHVQPGEHLPRRALPQRRPGRAAPARPAARPARTGSVTVPARTSSRSYAVALQRGAGHRGAQADLGRDLAAVPAQRAVPQRGVDRGRGPRSRAVATSASSSSGASGVTSRATVAA